MGKRHVVALAAGALLVGGGSYAIAGAGDGPGNVPNSKRFQAELNSYQEVSSVSTPGFGEFDAWLVDPATVKFRLTYAGLEGAAFMSHIHFAQRSVNGGISVWLCGAEAPEPCPPQEGTVTGTFTAADIRGPAERGMDTFAELLRAMRAGHTYVNVHTNPKFGGGEIRGQINNQDQREFDR